MSDTLRCPSAAPATRSRVEALLRPLRLPPDVREELQRLGEAHGTDVLAAFLVVVRWLLADLEALRLAGTAGAFEALETAVLEELVDEPNASARVTRIGRRTGELLSGRR